MLFGGGVDKNECVVNIPAGTLLAYMNDYLWREIVRLRDPDPALLDSDRGSENKVFKLATLRGYMPAGEEMTQVGRNNYLLATQNEEEAGRFRIVGNLAECTLYNVDLKKYVSAIANRDEIYVDEPNGTFNIYRSNVEKGGMESAWIIKSNVSGYWMQIGGSNGFANSDSWKEIDQGNLWVINGYLDYDEEPGQPEEPEVKMLRTYRLSVSRGFMPKDDGLHTASSEEEAGSYALIQKEGTEDYYLYCVDNGMFVTSARFEGSRCFTPFPSGTFRIAAIDGTDRVTVRSSVSGNMIQVDGDKWVCLNTWSTLDAGNQWTITECGEFDATEVLSKVALAEAPATDATTIYYTGSYNDIVNPNLYNLDKLGANIICNTYEDGKGRIVFDGPITTIVTEFFASCTALKTVVLPEGVTEIGFQAFFGCSNLFEITLPSTLTKIGENAFIQCWLPSVKLPGSLKSIGTYAFLRCKSLMTIDIPESVDEISEGAFGECTGLESVTGKYATDDQRCLIKGDTLIAFAPAGLTSYTIPSNVTRIGLGAFNSCARLTSVEIPSSVVEIGYVAFAVCSRLTELKVNNITPPALGYNTFYGVDKTNCTVVVPDESVELYRQTDGWKDFGTIMGISEYDPSANQFAFDPNRTYKLRVDRGYLPRTNGTVFATTDEAEAGNFALLQVPESDEYYIYSADNGMFIQSINFGSGRGLVASPNGTFVLTPIGDTGRFVIASTFSGNYLQVDSQPALCVTTWKTLDAGNQWTIAESGDFDPTEVYEKLGWAKPDAVENVPGMNNADHNAYRLDGTRAGKNDKGLLIIGRRKYVRK